jgi:hypothetical protein
MINDEFLDPPQYKRQKSLYKSMTYKGFFDFKHEHLVKTSQS